LDGHRRATALAGKPQECDLGVRKLEQFQLRIVNSTRRSEQIASEFW
jgi:hypothetical protein